MKEHSRKLLDKALDSIEVAEGILDMNKPDMAASRAYYAASTLLLNAGLDTSKHSGVIALIHRHFVKSGKLSKKQGRNLNWLLELRGVGDYGVSLHVESVDAKKAVDIAKDFYDATNALLNS